MSRREILEVKKIKSEEFEKLRKALKPLVVPLEQTPIWGNFDDSVAGRKFLGSFKYSDDNGKLVAVASATLYEDKGRSWIWIKHGPLFAAAPNTEVQRKMCQSLIEQFKDLDQQPMFIRLTMPQKISNLVLPFENTMYDQTVIVDLSDTEDVLLANMSQSGRKSIRSAVKADVIVEEIKEGPAQYFTKHCYPILKETGKRDGFGIHPLEIYTAMLEILGENAQLFVSKAEGKVAAWAITTLYDSSALYYYGGSSQLAHKTSAAYILHWEIMKNMKLRGALTYDFMGIAGDHYPALKNVTLFKLKFSKNIVSLPVTYDLPLQKARYQLITKALRLKRRLAKIAK